MEPESAIDRLNALQARVLNHEEVTPEEMKEVIQALRSDRAAAVMGAETTRTPRAKKGTSEPLDLAALFGGK